MRMSMQDNLQECGKMTAPRKTKEAARKRRFVRSRLPNRLQRAGVILKTELSPICVGAATK
jgi:hypothetical protein